MKVTPPAESTRGSQLNFKLSTKFSKSHQTFLRMQIENSPMSQCFRPKAVARQQEYDVMLERSFPLTPVLTVQHSCSLLGVSCDLSSDAGLPTHSVTHLLRPSDVSARPAMSRTAASPCTRPRSEGRPTMGRSHRSTRVRTNAKLLVQPHILEGDRAGGCNKQPSEARQALDGSGQIEFLLREAQEADKEEMMCTAAFNNPF